MSDNLDNALTEFDMAADVEEPPVEAMYRVDPATKIAVSKKYGAFWKSRLDAGEAARKDFIDAADECIAYYNNNQTSHREGNGQDVRSGNRYYSKRRNSAWSETENVVYSNIKAMLPSIYAKNPQVTFSAPSSEHKPMMATLERLVNLLAALPHAPGVNLAVHAKQAVLAAELTNLGWIHFGYTERSQSSSAAMDQLAQFSLDLQAATDVKQLAAIEGKLMALEEELSVVNAAGPWVAYRSIHDVVCDPDSTLPDHSDDKWRAVRIMYPTDYLNAKYGRKEDETDPNSRTMSLYEPTDVLVGGGDVKDEGDTFKLFNKESNAHAYGYRNQEELRKAGRTCCWMIYDKTTRRIYLYAANKMDGWPIWVANDPYGLPQFYPMEPLYFNTTPLGNQARSPVTYYLDQQDAINEIHSEYRKSRQDVRENILYDARFDKAAVEEWLTGDSGTARAVKVPDGMKLSDMIHDKPNLMMKMMPLFDLERPFKSIDRISGVSDVMRNEQYKTNTTNKAIEQYNSNTGQRLDEKVDAVENFLGRVMYGIGFLCAQFMTAEEVRDLLGSEKSADWQQYDAIELRHMFMWQAVGGSSQKPTSQAKQQQAMQLADILSKFMQFAPKTVLETTLTLLDEAFNEMQLPQGAFANIAAEVAEAMQRGNSVQGGGGGGAPGSAPPAPGGGGGAPPDVGAVVDEVSQAIDSLPPEAKLALGKALAQGAPIKEALPEVLAAIQQSAQQ